MQNPRPPTDAGADEVWAQLQRRLLALRGFGFMVLFVKNASLLPALKLRLRAWSQASQAGLLEVAVTEPDGFAEAALASLFGQLRARPVKAVWLEAHRGEGQPDWDAQRQALLSRLNERRSRLEEELAGGFVLTLPGGAERLAASFAPDLWHVRLMSQELSLSDGVGAPLLDAMESSPAPRMPPAPAAAAGPQDWLQRWHDTFGPVPLETLDRHDERLLEFSVWIGIDELHAQLAAGRLAQAFSLGEALAAFARWRAEGSDRLLDVGLRREWMAALLAWAEVLLACGDLLRMREVSQQALVIARDLVSRLAGSTEALRDLAQSLYRLGRACAELGDWAQADQAYAESLDLARELASRQSGAPQALRDVAIALDDLGRVAMMTGDLARAERLYREGLSLRRDLARRGPTQAVALRDITVSLNNLARIARAQADWTQAEAYARESLALRYQLLDLRPDSLEAERDLAVALRNLGRARAALGDIEQAETLGRDSLDHFRRLAAKRSDTPEASRDLSVALDDLGDLARRRGDWAAARALFQESLDLARDQAGRMGDAPEALDDLAVSLVNVGRLPSGDAALLAEALQIRESLVQRYPDVKRYAVALAALRGSGADNPPAATSESP